MVKNIDDILFIDIETIPQYNSFDLLTNSSNFEKKYINNLPNSSNLDSENINDIYITKASLNAEFGKLLTFSVGGLRLDNEILTFKHNSLSSYDEKSLLLKLKTILDNFTKVNKNLVLCGHNIIKFDIPFLCKRFIINGVKIPDILNVTGKKPWEINHVDTMKIWDFGSNEMVSLSLLADTLGVENPKTNFHGGNMFRLLINNVITLDDVTDYCSKDTKTVSDIYLKIKDLI